MIFHAGFWRSEIAKLLVGTVIIMEAIWQSAVQPIFVGFDTEVVESCLGKTAFPPTAFKCHLGEDDRRGDAVFLLLSHGGMRILLEKIIRSENVFFIDVKCCDTLQLYIPDID